METKNESESINIYDLKLRKEKAKSLMCEYNTSDDKDDKSLNIIMSYDDTLPDIYFYKLDKNSNDMKLKERSFDLVDKTILKGFNINKKLNYKEIYFEIIEYIESIELDEPRDATNDFENEEFLDDDEENDSDSQSNNKDEIKEDSKFGEQDINIDSKNKKIKVDFKETNDLDENLSDTEFQKVLDKRINFDIKNILIKNEKLNVINIKNKFSQIFDACCSFINYKNNYPDDESELFYLNSIRYMLETYKLLKYKKFIKKIKLTNFIAPVTKRIKNNEINDNLKKLFYYYIMNTQYDFDIIYLHLLKNEETENKILNLDNYNFIIKNNNLYKKNDEEKILLENVDNYLVYKMIISDITFEDKTSDFNKFYYSLKGLLNNTPFKKEDGDKFWEEFLSSKILDDLVKILYRKENVFNQKCIIDLFKEHSYYFPNYNTSFTALSHKELFNMYFPPSKVECPDDKLKNTSILKMVDKAVNKVKVQHEWGHTSSAFLFFTLKIKYFTTPERKIKFLEKSDSKNIEINKEGGQAVEMLMYGRIIEDLNVKEAIFILINDNYNLSINEFRSEFISLEKKSLNEVFEKAMKNPNIDDYIKQAYEQYKKKEEYYNKTLQYYSFKIKENKSKNINWENIRFKVGQNYHHRHGHPKKKK